VPTLLFVYNADSGLFNLLAGLAHKVFSPETYPCRLCAITHGPLGMREEWKAFLAGIGQPIEFLHRDEFRRVHGMTDVPLPAVFRKADDGRVEPWVDAETINAAVSVDDLKRILSGRLEAG
jgi:hypothetical protein